MTTATPLPSCRAADRAPPHADPARARARRAPAPRRGATPSTALCVLVRRRRPGPARSRSSSTSSHAALRGLSLQFFTRAAAGPSASRAAAWATRCVGTLILDRHRVQRSGCRPASSPASTWPRSGAGRLADRRSASSPTCSAGCPRSRSASSSTPWSWSPMKRFSALAGGIALAIVMIPTVTRTTEELLKPGARPPARGVARASACRSGAPASSSCSAPPRPGSARA